ncbi:hypothetical protein ACVV2G_12460 [Streptomyces ziwulingensis]
METLILVGPGLLGRISGAFDGAFGGGQGPGGQGEAVSGAAFAQRDRPGAVVEVRPLQQGASAARAGRAADSRVGGFAPRLLREVAGVYDRDMLLKLKLSW